MKKLLSIFAAVAMLFGLASCSGDLHDKVPPACDLYIIGNLAGNNWSKGVKTTTVSTGVYEVTVGLQANAEVKFIDVEEPGDSWKNVTYNIGNSTDGSNYKLNNETSGTYKVTYDLANESFTLEKIEVYSFEGLTLKGGWEGWWADTKTLTSANEQTFYTSSGEHTPSGNEFGIFGTGSNLWEVTDLELDTETEMTYKASDGTNSTMSTSWESGIYKIVLKLTDSTASAPKATIKITKL